ncbi:DUF2125 domain-containing protein [Cognatiyoonia sp.]|uniref:DUF2125 domain-containing protein n=1 Tax=Cognatiyoonia sp. TaxID=2211652 RepID=UPI003F69E5A2
MTYLNALKASVCAVALVSANTAFADVTAEDVWNDWKDQFEIYGEDGISIGSKSAGDGKVVVTDLTMMFDDGTTKSEGTIASIKFEENGDGTVSVTMTETLPIMVEDRSGGNVTMTFEHSGLEILVSGDPDAMDYAINADRYAIVIDEIIQDGEVVQGDIRFVMNGLSGSYSTTMGEMRDITSDLAATSVDVLVDVTDRSTDGTILISGKLDALAFTANMSLPVDGSFEDPNDLFVNGFALDGAYSYDNANFLFDVNDGPDTANGTVSTSSSDIAVAINADKMSYNVATNDIAAQMTVPDMPFPVNVNMANYGVGIEMPLGQTEEPAPFGMSFDLVDLSINDEIWMLFDPMGQLPRDPATISMALSGTAKLFFDILDPEQAEAMENSDQPGELYSLDLDRLKLVIAGAMLTGDGSFNLDNDSPFVVPDMPRPEGQVTLNLKGGNKLIDTLVNMGLLPEDQAMGARMMMGMFARNVGDDELTSTLEVNSEGHILANGQRIQ